MKTHTTFGAVLMTVLALIMPTGAAAETCYGVDGEIATVNVSPTTQIGDLRLALHNSDGNVVFDQSGNLIGRITGAGFGLSLLSQIASFEYDSFVTDDDEARITAVRALDQDGMPCSFQVSQTITHIANGSGFFSTLSSVHIEAEGYVAFCSGSPGEPGNANELYLTGELCVE